MTDDDDRIDNNTVEPPKSNHSECEDLLVAYGRWVPMRNELLGFSSKNTSTPCKRIYCKQFPRYNMCRSMLFNTECSLYTLNSVVHGLNIENKPCIKRLKTMENS